MTIRGAHRSTDRKAATNEGTVTQSPCLLYVLHSATLYGTERMGMATIESLETYQRRVIFAPPAEPVGGVPSVLDACASAGIEAWPYDGRQSLVRQLWRLFRSEGAVDVITTSVTQSLMVAAVAAATRAKLRHLHAVHGGQTTNYRLKRSLLPFRLTFMAVSTHVKEILTETGVPEDRIVVAENFVAPPSGSALRETYAGRGPATDGQPLRVVVVARADEVKRLDMLVDAVSAGELDDMQIDVYGYGPLLDMLRERAEPYENLHFRGYDPDVSARLAEGDIFLHTCDRETFGLAVLEAFRAGIVVVVPNAGGTGTLVKHDETGLLYKPGDVADMVRTLRRAASLSSGELDRMAANARFELDSRFSSQHGARVYRQAFEELESQRRCAPPFSSRSRRTDV